MPKNVCAELSTQIIAEIGLTYCHPGKLEAMFLEIRHHRHLGHILLDDDFPVGIILPLVQLAPDVFFGDAQDIGKPADNNSFILQIHGKYRHTQTGSILHQRLPVPVVYNPPSGLNLYLSHPVVHCKHLLALTSKYLQEPKQKAENREQQQSNRNQHAQSRTQRPICGLRPEVYDWIESNASHVN